MRGLCSLKLGKVAIVLFLYLGEFINLFVMVKTITIREV